MLSISVDGVTSHRTHISSVGLSGYPTTRPGVDVVHDKVDAVVQIELVYDKVHEGGRRGTNYFADFVVNYGEADYSVNFVVNYTVTFRTYGVKNASWRGPKTAF